MKVLKIIGIIILILVVLVLGLVIFGPSEGHLERKITVMAPAEAIYADVSNFKTFNKWSPWFQVDPNAEYMWEGPPSGEGAKMTWYSEDENVGNGFMMITDAKKYEYVRMDMGFDQNGNRDFTDEGEEEPKAAFLLEEDGDQTTVTWTFDISGVSGFGKMMVVGLDMFLGPFYEEGLQALKKRVESRPTFEAKISVEEVTPILFAGLETTSSLSTNEMSIAMGEAYGKIMGAITENGLEMTGGYPLAISTAYDESSISMICGVPVSEGSTLENSDVSIMQSPEGTTVRALHFGAYESLKSTHDVIDQYAKYYGYEISGLPWEIYVTDPGVETDTAKWITEVYYPVK